MENYDIALKLFSAEPELWGGAFVDSDILVIKFANQTEQLAMATLLEAGIKGSFRLVATSVTYGELERATAALDVLTERREDLISWGPNYADSSVAVDSAGAAEGLVAAIGGLGLSPKIAVNIRTGQPPASSDASRWYDAISYNGGNALALSDGSGFGYCSTAFNLTNSSDGYAYGVTAGHCYQERVKTPTPRPDVQIFRTTGSRSPMGRGVDREYDSGWDKA